VRQVVELPLLCKDFHPLPLSACIRHGLPGAGCGPLLIAAILSDAGYPHLLLRAARPPDLAVLVRGET